LAGDVAQHGMSILTISNGCYAITDAVVLFPGLLPILTGTPD